MTDIENKYQRKLRPRDCIKGWVDVYAVLELFEVNEHALGHAIKKLLMAGNRGAKGYEQDLRESIMAIERILDDLGSAHDIQEREDNKCYDKDNNPYDIPEGATNFQEFKSGGYGFFKVTDGNVFELNDHTGVWRQHGIDSAYGVRIAIQNKEIKPISEFPHKEKKYTFHVVDATKTLKPKEISETEAPKEEVKPGFININGHMVPEPEREELLNGEPYYVADMSKPSSPWDMIWYGNDRDYDRLDAGAIHTTKEAAELHAKALLSFTKKGES